MTTNPIRTGLPTLDRLLGGGLRPGGLTLIAGRSQSGMTTLLDTICCQAAFHDQVATVLADLETSTADRMLRICSALSGAPLFDMQRFTLSPGDKDRLRAVERANSGRPFWFADDTRTLDGLRAALVQHTPQARLLLVDGMRFLTHGQAAEVAVDLANLAADHGIAVVATQPVDWHGGHVSATLRDLSTAMVMAADAVVLLHRPSLDGQHTPGSELGVTVTAARYGDGGWFPAVADFEHARLAEPAADRVTS